MILTWKGPAAIPRFVTINPREITLAGSPLGACSVLVTVAPLEMTSTVSFVAVVWFKRNETTPALLVRLVAYGVACRVRQLKLAVARPSKAVLSRERNRDGRVRFIAAVVS